MTTYTIYGSTEDGRIKGSSATYSTARTTATSGSKFNQSDVVGQDLTGGTYECYELFFLFNCSGISGSETVSSAVLNLWLSGNSSVTDFTVNLLDRNWGPTFDDTADWVSGASLSGLTLLGALNTSALGSTNAYYSFSDVAMAALVDAKSSTTAFMAASSRQDAGNTPTGHEYVTFALADASGTTNDPYLNVTAAGGVVDHPLTAGAGSFAVTGTAANVKVARLLSAGAGAYALTGTAALVKAGRAVAAGAGSYAYTGTAAALLHKDVLAAGSGSFALTGTDASLKKGWVLAAASGSFAVSGSSASLLLKRVLAAGAGSYAVTGTDAGLSKSSNKSLAAGSGSYAITGSTAGFLRTWRLVADSGSFTITGTDAQLVRADAQPILIQDFDGGFREKSKRERDAKERRLEQALRDIIERAFATVEGVPVQPDKPLPPPKRKELARTVQAEIRLDGFAASINRIDALIRDYERQLMQATQERERQLDEEDIILLLLAH